MSIVDAASLLIRILFSTLMLLISLVPAIMKRNVRLFSDSDIVSLA